MARTWRAPTAAGPTYDHSVVAAIIYLAMSTDTNGGSGRAAALRCTRRQPARHPQRRVQRPTLSAASDAEARGIISFDGWSFVREGDTLVPVSGSAKPPALTSKPMPTHEACLVDGAWLALPLVSEFSSSEH
jgi:hypothetical protein